MAAKRKPDPKPDDAPLSLPPLKEWLASESNQSRLASILKDPVFLAAAQYVMEQNRLTSATLVTEAMPDSVIARRASVHAGCVEFISGLRNLISSKPRQELPEPYAHIKPNQQ